MKLEGQQLAEETLAIDHSHASPAHRELWRHWSARSRYCAIWPVVPRTSSLLLSLIVPFYLSFVVFDSSDTASFSSIFWTLTITDCIALADLITRFRTSFITAKGVEVHTPSDIARRYLRSAFALDCAAAVPWVLIGNLSNEARSAAYLLSLTRFLKHIPVAWVSLESRSAEVLRLGAVLYLCTHWFACVWFLVASGEGIWKPSSDIALGTDIYAQNAMQRYCLFWYISAVVLVQGGEFYCVSTTEVIIMVIAEVAGVLGFTMIFSKVCVLVQVESQVETTLKSRIDTVDYVASTFSLPEHLYRDLINAVGRQQHALVFRDVMALESMSESLYCEVLGAIVEPVADSPPLRTLLSGSVGHYFLSSLHLAYCIPGEVVFREFERQDCCYFIARGSITVSLLGLQEKRFSAGEVVGVAALNCVLQRMMYTAVADSNVLLFTLSSSRAAALQILYPQAKEALEVQLWRESEHWYPKCRFFLDKIPYFSPLPPRLKLELALAVRTRQFDSGQAIVQQGQPLHEVIYIHTGKAAIHVYKKSKALEMIVLEAGSVYGLYTAGKATNVQSVDVLATGDSECFLLSAEMVHELALVYPAFNAFTASLADSINSDFICASSLPPTPQRKLREVVLKLLRGVHRTNKLSSSLLATHLLTKPKTIRIDRRAMVIVEQLLAAQSLLRTKVQEATERHRRVAEFVGRNGK